MPDSAQRSSLHFVDDSYFIIIFKSAREFLRLRVHFCSLSFLDEKRNGDLEPRFERCRLDHTATRGVAARAFPFTAALETLLKAQEAERERAATCLVRRI